MLSLLKDARLNHDPPLRLVDVANKAGVSVSLVSMVESGYTCSQAKREAIALAVGASYGSFWPPQPDAVRAVTPTVEPRP